MKKLYFFLVAILCIASTYAQSYSDSGPADNFQSRSNPHYWKNRPPYEGYWQQDVAYKIKANIDEVSDIITGYEELTYTNNSPDTLYFVYFNLYQNAYQPGSYLDKLHQENDVHPHYGKYESARLGITLDEITANGNTLKTQYDNTVVRIYLDKPLLPHTATTFNIKFRTYYDNGSVRRRMKKYGAWGYKHYNGCQWYPKICVYDRKAGWNTDQHLGRELAPCRYLV